MRLLPALACALLGCVAASARADVIHLRNGRTLEGTVLGQDAKQVRLRVSGGTFVLPRDQVRRIERKEAPAKAYARRAARVDMEDPEAVEELAHWASSNRLGARARQLRQLARGLRLERRVAAAKASESPSALFDTYAWARAQRFSSEVQIYLLEGLLERWPEHEGAQRALARLRSPSVEATRGAPPALDPESEAQREEAVEGAGQAAGEGALSAEEAARLRARLARREAEAKELRERVEALEEGQGQARRRRPRRRRRGGGSGLSPLFIVQSPGSAGAEGPIQPPTLETPQRPSRPLPIRRAPLTPPPALQPRVR